MFPQPELFGLSIDWYRLWLAIASITSLVFAILYYKYHFHHSLSYKKIALAFITSILAIFLGGKCFALLDYYLAFKISGNSPEYATLHFGLQGLFRWYGSLIFLVLAIPIFAQIFPRNKYYAFLDYIALVCCLFTGIVKQACLFSGDGCYGITTSSFLGMYFPYGKAPTLMPVHPTPLYDSIFHLLFFLFLLHRSTTQKYSKGQVIYLFFAGTAIFNILLDMIRINPVIFLSLTLAQLSYSFLLLLTILYYYTHIKNTTAKTLQCRF